jgi:carbonic anhydrase/acetyltransferase-like protein (isoleucine patch superfamily)
MIYPFQNKKPSISKNVFLAETACIIGDVSIGEKSSVWFNSVLRGDMHKINIGQGSHIQDNVVIHASESSIEIGDGVTIEHGSVIHDCTIKNNVLIGMHVTVLGGSEIGELSIVEDGTLVPSGCKIPAKSVIFGIPCKHVRRTTGKDLELIKITLKKYEEMAEKYLKQ